MGQDLLLAPSPLLIARVALQLTMAAVLAGVVGAQREATGKSAGLRTHMMVSLGSALFVLVPIEAGISPGDLTRVIQGIATGIGFVGAGAILKRTDRSEIEGLTTAATIWLTGAIGIAVGAGQAWLAALAAAIAWIILAVVPRVDHWIRRSADED